MGHSYVDFRERTQQMHDADIIVLTHVMMDLVRRQGTDAKLTPNVAELLESWRAIVVTSGPGCIDLSLDRFVLDEKDRSSLLQLAREAGEYVREFGSVLPADYLNRLIDAPEILEFEDQPTEKALAAYAKFIGLLMDE